MTAQPGQLWENLADLERGTTRTYLLLSSPTLNVAGCYQVQAYCLERRRVERFNAGKLLNRERWRQLAADPA